jgi:hypothetical protein
VRLEQQVNLALPEAPEEPVLPARPELPEKLELPDNQVSPVKLVQLVQPARQETQVRPEELVPLD